jgi:hypothetical protein
MTNQELFELLLEQFLVLNENRDRLIEAATTGQEAAQILDAWRQANLNQLEMGNKIIIDNSPQLQNLVAELKTVQNNLKDAIASLQTTANVLGTITSVINQAVSLGTQIVALA